MFQGTRQPDFKHVEKIDYDAYWLHRGLAINEKLKEREELMFERIPSGARVLDVGCGNSRLPLVLRDKGVKVEVADISKVVLALYAEHTFITYTLDLEHPDTSPLATYDYIILSEVLEHITNPEEVLAMLKPHTTRFLITVPNSAFYRYRFHLMFAGRFFTQWVHHPSEHVRFWSHIDFLEWLSAQGLVVEESVASNGFSFFGLMPFVKNLHKNLFGHQILYVCSTAKR